MPQPLRFQAIRPTEPILEEYELDFLNLKVKGTAGGKRKLYKAKLPLSFISLCNHKQAVICRQISIRLSQYVDINRQLST